MPLPPAVPKEEQQSAAKTGQTSKPDGEKKIPKCAFWAQVTVWADRQMASKGFDEAQVACLLEIAYNIFVP